MLLPRIKMENTFGVALQSLLAESHGIVVRSLRILRLANLNHRATAVPAVRWIILRPERIGRR